MDTDIIDERMVIYGFEHFFKRRVIIKTLFWTKAPRDQHIYKWYLYSRPFISDTAKNYMWDYLQDDISELDFVIAHQTCMRK